VSQRPEIHLLLLICAEHVAAAPITPHPAGPTVLEVFNTLLRQLRQSVDYQLTGYHDNAGKRKTNSREEKTLQDTVIKTIGEDLRRELRGPLRFSRFICSVVPRFAAGAFANTLPVYQRSEVMLFIMGKIPVPGIYPALGSPNAGYVSHLTNAL